MASLETSEFLEYVKQGAVLLDVRTPDEYNAGHLQNAANIDVTAPNFQSSVGTLDKTKKYAVYCRSGGRSATAVSILESLGFDARDLKGGLGSLQ